jgi:Fur family ferric uptake transcriptional regulator
MTPTTAKEFGTWAESARERISEAGLRRSMPRQRVVDLLDQQDCAITALEIDARLDRVGRATVYRAIEQLEELGLVRKVDLGGSAFGYEKVEPSGHHHHHIVCDECGKVEPFEDDALEEAIHEIHRKGFKLESHEVTLHGHCADCD